MFYQNRNALRILFFMNLSHVECVRITDGKKLCESFTEVKDSHVFVTSVKKIARILHKCDKNVRIFHTCDRFVWLSHSNESVSRVNNSHVFVIHVKKIEQILHMCDKYVRILHRSKIRHLWKNSYLLKSQNWSYVYFTHTEMWRIRANNSQRVKNTTCEY